MRVNRLDHLVLTVADLEATVRFYSEILGMRHERFGGGRSALVFGESKINLHRVGHEYEPKAHRATAGSADICLIVDEPIESVAAELERNGVALEQGPIRRTGARGPIISVYVRDPDLNLIELSSYEEQ